MTTTFWYNNPSILFQYNKLNEFYPNINMDLNDKLNQPLFKSHSRIERFLKGCKAIINQRPRYPWRYKNNNKPE